MNSQSHFPSVPSSGTSACRTRPERALALAMLAMMLLQSALLSAPESEAIAPTHFPTDVPTWEAGDEWTYEVSDNSSSMTTEMELMLRVEGLESVQVGTSSFECYVLDISGKVTGTSGIYTLTGNVAGTRWVRRSDLALIKEQTTINGTAMVVIFPGTYVAFQNHSYDPPLEEYDFPLDAQDSWSESSSEDYQNDEYINIAGLFDFNNTDNGTTTANFSAVYAGLSQATVPAGTFATDLIRMTTANGTVERHYSDSVGNVVWEEVRDSGVTTVTKLKSYKLNSQPVLLGMGMSPRTSGKGQVVELTGAATYSSTGVPVAQAPVIVTFPETGGVWNTTTADNGSFMLKLAAPSKADDTPTARDLGSHGLVITVKGSGSYTGFMVTTLTVLEKNPPDLAISKDDITVRSATEGVEISASIRVRNAGLGESTGVDVCAKLDGSVLKNWTLERVRPGDKADLTVKFLAAAGNHSLDVSIDINDTIVETDETNNRAIRNFTVGMHDLSVTAFTISNQAPNEGDAVAINASILNSGAALSESFGVELHAGTALVYSGELPAIDGGITLELSVNWSTVPGIIDIVINVDPQNKIAEASELNNEASIRVEVNAAPRAMFNITTISAGTFRFDAGASYDPDGTIVAITWDFGDGTTGSGVSVEHSYTRHRDMRVVLRLFDEHGAMAGASAPLSLPNSPPVAVALSRINTTVGEQVVFEGSGADRDGGIVRYEWDFVGKGFWDWSSNTSGTAVCVYNVTGVFYAVFRVTDTDGATATATTTVMVNPTKPVSPVPQPQIAPTTTESTGNLAAILSILTLIIMLAMAYFISVRLSRVETIIENIAESGPMLDEPKKSLPSKQEHDPEEDEELASEED